MTEPTATLNYSLKSTSGYEVEGSISGITPDQWGDLTRVMHGKPIDMVLHCRACGLPHIDKDESAGTLAEDVASYGEPWRNPPHRSHKCHGCGHIWRPADVPTNGVAAVKTKGKNDSPIVHPTPPEEIHETFDTTTEAGRWQAESASYALEAVFQIVPDVKPRDDDAVLMSMSQVENLMRHFGWVPPSEGRKPAGVVSQEPYRKLPVVPDFDAVKDKRMSELTPTQQDDARELWLRNSWQTFLYTGEHIEFLLRRLDEARGVTK